MNSEAGCRTKLSTVHLVARALVATLLFATAFTQQLCVAQQPAFLTNGLVAYYPFDGNVNDYSENTNNGVIHGSGVSFTSDRFGKPLAAVTFNADGVSYVSVARNQSFESTPITVSAWIIKPSITSDYQSVISMGEYNLGTNDLNINFNFQNNLEFNVYREQLFIQPQYGIFNHYVVVYSGFNEKVYKDGVFVGQTDPHAFTTRPASLGDLCFGRSSRETTFGYFWFNGSIDDVRLYNRALSDAEVKALYDYESVPQPDQATATATVVNGFVVGATITDGGYGYVAAPSVQLLGGGGTGATATASISNSIVTAITITNPGKGYTNAPIIAIDMPPSPPPIARQATATASVVGGFVVGATISDPGSGYITIPNVNIIGGGGTGATASAVLSNSIVSAIVITNPGHGYTNPPSIAIDAPPHQAVANAQQVGGFVVNVDITDGGGGYATIPRVTLVGGGGTGATATATLMNTSVTAITITNPGHGYTNAPSVVIDPPPYPPQSATASVQVVDGFVVGATVINGGHGYSANPTVTFTGGGGTGASAVATVVNGSVSSLQITNPGSGYTSIPTVSIELPTSAIISLVASTTVNGNYAVVSDATVDTVAKRIQVLIQGSARFFRVQGSEKIVNTTLSGGVLEIWYQ
jgi:Concanavalin A-like lectin/glucanases superfamily